MEQDVPANPESQSAKISPNTNSLNTEDSVNAESTNIVSTARNILPIFTSPNPSLEPSQPSINVQPMSSDVLSSSSTHKTLSNDNEIISKKKNNNIPSIIVT